MPRIEYQRIRFTADHLDVIDQARGIISEYQGQGYDLTLRQLYYQFVSRGYIPNTQQSYKRLGDIISRGRLAGHIDWLAIVDRTRGLAGTSHWETPASVIDSAAYGFRLDKWTTQPRRVEIWVEKEALAGVVSPVARRRDLDYFSCRGYASQSEVWLAARRILGYVEAGQAVTILHLGDHDPSGIDMTRDIVDRLNMFTAVDWIKTRPSLGTVDTYDLDEVRESMSQELGQANPIEIRRIALNWNQVQQYNPPPNPTKLTDSRANGYLAKFGRESWELDALNPTTLANLINAHVDGIVDQEAYDVQERAEARHRDLLRAAADRWDELVEVLEA